jgi:hypothetical protein
MAHHTRILVCMVATAVVACEMEHVDHDEVVIASAEAARDVARHQGVEARFRETLQRTADGEQVRVFVADMAPSREVPVGARCGTTDADGTLLSCVPGSYCFTPGDGHAASCVASHAAPALP